MKLNMTYFLSVQPFDFLAGSTAVTDMVGGDLCTLNPFLSPTEVNGIHTCVLVLMMVSNRINQSNLALLQARSLLKLLNNVIANSVDPGSDKCKKELVSFADTLAATLAAKRHFGICLGGGVFEIDPRFLLFEYCHGLLLRKSQVDLIRKLMQNMVEGKSACHQVCICELAVFYQSQFALFLLQPR